LRVLFGLTMLLAMSGIARANGHDIFNAHCVICHQSDGAGVPGMYPPLADSLGSYVAIPAGRAYIVHIVSFGLTGAISVHGQTYIGVMQPWPKFTDDEVAQVVNYVLTTFNAKTIPKDFAPLTTDEVRRYRTTSAALGDVHKEGEALMKALAAHPGGGS
jgi:mono/diheme cytochrome c family protein